MELFINPFWVEEHFLNPLINPFLSFGTFPKPFHKPFLVYGAHKPFHIPFTRVYERVFESHKPLKGLLYVALSYTLLRVYESQIPFHIPF